MTEYTATELMTVLAARFLTDSDVCFVGAGTPATACDLARLTHAPNLTLADESGALGIAGEEGLSEVSASVSVTEMFQYWLQGGRFSVGLLEVTQLDRYANINTTVIGDYAAPKIRLPGAGSISEVTAHCGRVCITVRHSPKTLVPRVDFLTALGFGPDGRSRERLGIDTAGPALVITDLCQFKPDPRTHELTVTSVHRGVSQQSVRDATGWPVRFADDVTETISPAADELRLLRQLEDRLPGTAAPALCGLGHRSQALRY